jgi:cyclohexanone monooxygenase
MGTELDLQKALGLDFDPEALREKYRVAREERLHPGHDNQYIKVEGELSGYLEDRFVREKIARSALDLDVNVVIIGGGFAGLQTAVRLAGEGVGDFLIVDRCPDFGGNWYWNRYPGAACDSESYCYLPLLDETGYVPSRRYTDAEEIWQHAQRIGQQFDLYRRAVFQTDVTSMTWDDEQNRWVLGTDRGDVLRARFVVLAAGETYSAIKLPGIPGISSFKGHSFHTARWDYAYTGGTVRGGLHKLAGKRVAIIGTGCSAVQIIPHLGESAEQVYVFQRTPAHVAPRNNHPTDPAWAGNLVSGWQQRRMWNLIANMDGEPGAEPLHDSGFADLANALRDLAQGIAASARKADIQLSLDDIMELSNMQYMEGMRSRIDAIVRDPVTAEALKPYYAAWCKRPTWSDAYFETFNRPNVTLVNCPKGVDRITENTLVANGTEYEADLIIYGSGYEVAHSSIFQIVRFPLVGRRGVTLEEHWKDSYRTLHGMMMHNLPNYFQLTVIGNGLGANYLYGNGKQAAHVAWIIARCLEQAIGSIEPTVEAEDEWRQALDESQRPAANPRWGAFMRMLATCTPGYQNNEGAADDVKGLFANLYGHGINAYVQYLQEWRDAGDMFGLATTRTFS